MLSIVNPSISDGVREAGGLFTMDAAKRSVKYGLSGILGMAVGKLSKGALAAILSKVYPQAANWNVAVSKGLGGLAAVLGVRFVSGALVQDQGISEAMTVGALIDALRPATNAIVAKIPGGPAGGVMDQVRQAMLGAFYVQPMGSEPATRTRLGAVNGYSPDDVGASVSPDFPAMAALGTVTPNYANNTGYNRGQLSGLGLFQPPM